MNLFKRIVHKTLTKIFVPHSQLSYSQFGEDLILSTLFYRLGFKNPTYIDIGANEPKYISNTYYFYLRGSSGVLIEPNPKLYQKLRFQRPNDIVINCGIGFSESENADYYIFPDYASGLNTFSKKEAEYWQNTGMVGRGPIPIKDVIRVPLKTINSVLFSHYNDKKLNFISIDVEGLDFEIVKSIDFEKYCPDVLCIETLKYNEIKETFKDNDIINYMLSKNYGIYADTRVNTIFCRNEILNK